jgi:hypothetical protein
MYLRNLQTTEKQPKSKSKLASIVGENYEQKQTI